VSTIEAAFDDSAALGAPANVAASPWVVMKFGGTSVSSVENWETIARLVKARLDAGLNPVVVHSALRGVSNALEDTLAKAVAGDP
jgi:diaminopimelate decarboxylase/aspartate kinase